MSPENILLLWWKRQGIPLGLSFFCHNVGLGYPTGVEEKRLCLADRACKDPSPSSLLCIDLVEC